MLIKPTKLEHARVELLKSIILKKNTIEVPLEKASERISNKKIDSKLNLPSTENSAVDGYGISSSTYFDNPNTLARKLSLRGVPTTILFNKEGKEFARIIGSIDFRDEKFINWLENYN